jgi:SAM-dependent methyltransferase
MPRFTTSEIQRYYDRHTPAFLKFGQGGRDGAIHRAVRGPNRRAAPFHYVDDQIANLTRDILTTSAVPHLLDLGCGVGASLCYLAERLPIRGTGVTLSPVQAHLATERIEKAGLSYRVSCIEADYCAIPARVPPADLAYAIESFVHGPSPERFFAECARLVRPGGLLVICDDFKRKVPNATAARTINRFCRGWHINTLLRQDQLQEMARSAGFEHQSTVDLTSAVETGRVRDRAIDMLGALCGWLPFGRGRIDYLLGGSALQRCLRRGWIGYDLAVFRKI